MLESYYTLNYFNNNKKKINYFYVLINGSFIKFVFLSNNRSNNSKK